MNTTHNISTTSCTIAPTVGVFHYVDLDEGTDRISVDGVVHVPSEVLGSGSHLWVWHDGVRYHAADWSGDSDDVTPLVAVASAESALTWKADANAKLRELAALVPTEMAAHVAACEFSSEDDTPTLHIDLWRGYDLLDLPQAVAELAVAAEGNWDGGRSYSLQLA